MAVKQIAIRVPLEVAEQLRLRSALERRTVNDIVGEAIADYTRSHPVSRADMLAMVRAIAAEDASLLKALEQA